MAKNHLHCVPDEPQSLRAQRELLHAIDYDLFILLTAVGRAILQDADGALTNAEVAFAFEEVRYGTILLPLDDELAIETIMRWMIERLRRAPRRPRRIHPFDPRPRDCRPTFAKRHRIRESTPEVLFEKAGPMLEMVARIVLGEEHAHEAAAVVASARLNALVGIVVLSSDVDEAVAQLVRNVIFIIDFVYPPDEAAVAARKKLLRAA